MRSRRANVVLGAWLIGAALTAAAASARGPSWHHAQYVL